MSKKKGNANYQTYGELLREKEEKAAEDDRRKKAMEEAEKLRPITLIRSQQQDRFIRTVATGDNAMMNELDQ